MYRMRLSTFRMKTCAALNGAVESTVPDKLAVPGRAAPCGAAGLAATDPLAPKTAYAIARLPINPMISRDDLALFQLLIISPPGDSELLPCIVTESGLSQNKTCHGSGYRVHLR